MPWRIVLLLPVDAGPTWGAGNLSLMSGNTSSTSFRLYVSRLTSTHTVYIVPALPFLLSVALRCTLYYCERVSSDVIPIQHAVTAISVKARPSNRCEEHYFRNVRLVLHFASG